MQSVRPQPLTTAAALGVGEQGMCVCGVTHPEEGPDILIPSSVFSTRPQDSRFQETKAGCSLTEWQGAELAESGSQEGPQV